MSVVELIHARLGKFKKLRVEGNDWIVESATGKKFRFNHSMRANFEIIGEQPATFFPIKSQPAGVPVSFPLPQPPPSERVNLIRTFENLRNGQPPVSSTVKDFAIGIGESTRAIKELLEAVDEKGGASIIFRGSYGNGKTLTLQLAEETALEQRYVTVRTEIDASENQLSRPHNIIRSLLANMRIPGINGRGSELLAKLTVEHLKKNVPCTPGLEAVDNFRYLKRELGCEPIAWLMSDPELLEKPELLALLACDSQVSVSEARQIHAIGANAKLWPTFRWRTQGDFASYIMAGLGRLTRLLGFKGMLVILDEMEKWERLNLLDQSRGANLLGGLIWGATEKHNRGKNDHPRSLWHSGWVGGYPFTTPERSYIGVAIALTPRGADGPEDTWKEYGKIDIIDLPTITRQNLKSYCSKVADLYAKAYELKAPTENELAHITSMTVNEWQTKGAHSVRDAVPMLMLGLDQWRRSKK